MKLKKKVILDWDKDILFKTLYVHDFLLSTFSHFDDYVICQLSTTTYQCVVVLFP
jgi:hypothetical protein